ncbi:PTS fructose transporter subunit IIA [Quisquiliibacterium transsilvanicum]|nr:PTS fructose transporter subunit IIA [Quisquiliibacterium transsilvanicum]
MIGILVVSHEPLGTALIHCTRHIFGRMPPQLAALDVIPDEDPAAALAGARELMSRINDGSGVLVLTDIYGATPSRIAAKLAEPHRVVVIAGVNLPLLVKALYNRRVPLDEVTDMLSESARNAILEIVPQAAPGDAADGSTGEEDGEGNAKA